MIRIITIIIILMSWSIGIAGKGIIEGYVTDAESGDPLPGATVKVKGTSCGAVSDIEGFYIILAVPPGQHDVEASYIGYATVLIKYVTVESGKTTKLDIRLPSETMESEAIVVDGSESTRSSSGGVTFSSQIHKGQKSKDSKSEIPTEVPFIGPPLPKTSVNKSNELSTSSTEAKAEEDLSSFYSLIKKRDGSKAPSGRPSASGLRAGFADDNKQYNYFLNFLDKYAADVVHQKIDVSDRLRFIFKDQDGKVLPNARVNILNGENLILSGKTYPDGSFNFFPKIHSSLSEALTMTIDYKGKVQEYKIELEGNRKQDLSLKLQKQNIQQAPLDILFILDTTGSMGEEIERLRTTIDLIHLNLTSIGKEVQVRFGMVLYRDRDDDYVTQTFPLTADIEQFRQALDTVSAAGGGDGPEDLQSALEVALKEIDWNPDGIRLGFIITDAEPHLDYGQKYTYTDAAQEAKKRGIRLHSIGTGGLAINGEYILRQISQFTSGRYIFLTYGEEGESDGGTPGSVSHHTGANYQTDKLEAIIIQFAKEDLGYFLDKELKSDADYFLARSVDFEKSEETLQSLFNQALSQLIDYSTIRLPEKTVLGLLPLSPDDSADPVSAEYLTQQVLMAVKENSSFTLADRSNMNDIAEEWGLQLSGLTNDSVTVKVGELLNAETLLIGNLFSRNDEYELFLKLVRVETGELLAVTRLRIDRQLCPAG